MAREPARTRVVKREVTFDDGEIRQAEWEEPVKSRRPVDKRTGGNWFMTYVDNVLKLANMDLTGNDRRVLMILTTEMGFNEPFRYSTTSIAKKLGVRPQQVSRSIRILKDNDVIVDMNDGLIYVHPDYYWRGDDAHRKSVYDAIAKRVLTESRSNDEN